MVLSDREILIKLFRATGGDTTWKRKDGWDTDADISSWYGVTVRDGHVVKLRLSNNSLQGNAASDQIHYVQIFLSKFWLVA